MWEPREQEVPRYGNRCLDLGTWGMGCLYVGTSGVDGARFLDLGTLGAVARFLVVGTGFLDVETGSYI